MGIPSLVFVMQSEFLRFVSKNRKLKSIHSASKHWQRTFLYSAVRELVCNGQLWARAALRHRVVIRSNSKRIFLSSYYLACVSIQANTKPQARRHARPRRHARRSGGHYEGRGLWIRLYRYASQLVRSLLPD